MSPRRRANAAGKYLGSQTVLTGVALGGVAAAGVTHPGSAAVLAPAAALFGLGLGYWWRDAIGDWRGQRALDRLRAQQAAQQAEAIARLVEEGKAGQMTPEEIRARLLAGSRQPAPTPDPEPEPEPEVQPEEVNP